MDTGKINPNQNLWALAISFAALGAAEYYGLCTLFIFAVAIGSVTSLSYAIMLIPYTKRYWLNKEKTSDQGNRGDRISRPHHQRNNPQRPPQSTNRPPGEQ